ncbi:hypothetical protein E2562_006776 [Oryza meyeriana var. granulata]|uniref:NAC domain-containing protein n=1 Tax=Oryza meyeriana var. granulata TaxID=110450 RepID=A0A6G1C4H2_9ORYZ|nr:hypothetical protein E2562_006776 [Oryza meyeriana var. granulata]
MAGPGVCITLVNGTTMHLPTGCVFRPTEAELVVHYLYRRAIQVPLPCDFITDVDIPRHNPWDIVPGVLTVNFLSDSVCVSTFFCWVGHDGAVEEKKNGKHFFTRKENKHHGDHRSNRAAGDGFWRSAGSEVPVYYKAGGGADEVLVGMKRTLVFHYGKSSSAKRTEWAMQEFRLAGASLMPCPLMGQATGDGSMPPCGCAEMIIAKKNDGSLSAAHTHAPLGKTVVEPDSSWLICRIYKKRQRAPHVIIPPAIGNAGEVILTLPAIGNAGEGKVRFIDFLGQMPHIEPSFPNSCTIAPSFEEGSDESADVMDNRDGDGHDK